MKKIIVFSLMNLLFINAIAQENNENGEPQGKWRVSKEYDEQGNMISYDSVYVWTSGTTRDFEFFKNDSLPQHFKGFIRDFEMPFNFREGDSLGFGMRDYWQGFEFPGMDFQWFENDSIQPLPPLREFFNKDAFDFQKQIDELRKQMESIRKDFEEKQKSEAVEPKKMEEHKL